MSFGVVQSLTIKVMNESVGFPSDTTISFDLSRAIIITLATFKIYLKHDKN
jgi:hypothetical protein